MEWPGWRPAVSRRVFIMRRKPSKFRKVRLCLRCEQNVLRTSRTRPFLSPYSILEKLRVLRRYDRLFLPQWSLPMTLPSILIKNALTRRAPTLLLSLNDRCQLQVVRVVQKIILYCYTTITVTERERDAEGRNYVMLNSSTSRDDLSIIVQYPA